MAPPVSVGSADGREGVGRHQNAGGAGGQLDFDELTAAVREMHLIKQHERQAWAAQEKRRAAGRQLLDAG